MFGAGAQQVQGSAAGLLQSVVSVKNVRHDSVAGIRYRLSNLCSLILSIIDNGAFVISPETVWYARVLLLFSASAMTDTGSKSFDCAFVSTLEKYDDTVNGNYLY